MSNILGITEKEMQARHNQYHRENPDQWAREDSTFTIQELAFGVSQKPSWVRAVLRRAGRRAPEAARELLLPKSKRPCATCSHLRCHHCSGRVPRVHVNPGILGAYPCPLRVHCKGLVEVAPEQFTNCSCMHYTTRGSV